MEAKRVQWKSDITHFTTLYQRKYPIYWTGLKENAVSKSDFSDRQQLLLRQHLDRFYITVVGSNLGHISATWATYMIPGQPEECPQLATSRLYVLTKTTTPSDCILANWHEFEQHADTAAMGLISRCTTPTGPVLCFLYALYAERPDSNK